MVIPVELVVFLATLAVGFLGSIGSFAVHLLIKMNSNLTNLGTAIALYGVRIEALENAKERERV